MTCLNSVELERMVLFVRLLLLIVFPAALISSARFKGGKMGTTEYNLEEKAVLKGLEDKATFLKARTKAHDLLCVTFASSNVESTLLRDNMKLTSKFCDWAIIFYDANADRIKSRCNSLSSNRIVHCKQFPMDKRVVNNAVAKSVPKSILYSELLPYLPNYQRVALLDEDIGLSGFDYSNFKTLWDCAFPSAPLIVQPLIAEGTQKFEYVNLHSWQREENKKVIAAGTAVIEQQIPFFNAMFFDWFIRRVLVHTRDLVLEYGVEWGQDRVWCNAAQMYARVVLQQSENFTACALLPGATPVHHLNLMTIKDKRSNFTDFQRRGFHVVQKYIDLFPTWTVIRTNVTISSLKQKYPRVDVLRSDCDTSKNRL